MKPDADRHVDRRAWLADCARHTLLGGMTIAAGMLICRGQVGGQVGGQVRGQVRGCTSLSLACGTCQELAQCALFPAAEAREQLARREHH